MIAALLLVARTFLREHDLLHPTVTAILAATGAGRSRAYELSRALLAVLPSLARPAGRPATPPSPPVPPEPCAQLSRTVLRYVMEHPGCVTGSGGRRFYADAFRRRIIELRREHPDLELERFAAAVAVPAGTIEDWLRTRSNEIPVAADEPPNDERDEHDEHDDPSSARIESILAAWAQWRGNFTTFCEHVRHHLRIDYGRGLIARILHTHGERRRQRRPGRTPDEAATRDSFEVFFPGAQWVGDGMQVPVEINDTRCVFNLELDVDAFSGALVGASIRDEEDSQAVVEAFADGVATTGEPPLALLLDWRPSNHTDEVATALGDTLHMRATRARPQNKAHVEGAFGLFAQHAPPLSVHARDLHELAKAVLELRVTTWARTLNHRPRADRQGRSRVEIYRDASPSDDQIAAARRALAERCRKQELRAATMQARTDPLVRQQLDAAFARLQLADPGEHIRRAIAGHPRDAIVDGIAVFEGKKNAGTLPDGVDARYLLGIVRNIAHVHEADAVTEALICERLATRDRLLAALVREREQAVAAHTDTQQAARALIDLALAAERTVDRLFWLIATAELITEQPPDAVADLFRDISRRVHATFAIPRAERYAAQRILARQVWPAT